MTALVKKEMALAEPSNFTPAQIELIKSSLCKDLSNDEFRVFLYTCERTGLDPFAKQIYCIKRKDRMTIQTGIDGYRLIAERTGTYAPGPEPTFTYDENKNLLSATSYVKKLTKDGTWHTVACTAYYDEYVQKFNGKPADLWAKMPRVMLAKCAEALAIRKCYPAELSGVYTKEEMDQAETIQIVEAEAVPPIEYASAQQMDELEFLVSKCDPEKQASIASYIDSQCNGDLTKLPAKKYQAIVKTVLERMNQYQESLEASGVTHD